MKVKIINSSTDNLETIFTACKTCYSSSSPIDIYEKELSKEEKLKLIKQIAESGHLSTFEHVKYTFLIEGISRACSHQLVRHRHCSFSQQSQRYVDMRECDFVIPNGLNQEQKEDLDFMFKDCKIIYDDLLELGLKKEDARCILPNATKTNLVMTCNLRELMHICNLRLCTRAQKEIRTLFSIIVKEVTKLEPWLKDYLITKCEKNGFCTEHNCCGKRKHIKEIKDYIITRE